MPYTDKFIKIKKKYKRLYNDEAKILTLSFREAFGLKIPTFKNRTLKFKSNIQK